MKLLFAIDNLGRGGRERRIIELIKGLSKDPSFEISLLVFSNRIEYEEIRFLPINLVFIPRKVKKDLSIFFKVHRLCKSLAPDLIHAWGDMSTFYAIPASILLKIPIYNSNVADAPSGLSFFDKEMLRKKLTNPFSKKVIANSYAGLSAYKIPGHKGICIHNGFDFRRLASLRSASEIRQEFQVNDKKVIAMIGAFQDRKDYQTYLRAAKMLLVGNKDLIFLAIGEGDLRKEMMEYVGEGYEGRIIFTGLRKDIESIIQIVDIGVLATNSKVHGEGISNAILEFMAQAKPVIASKGGGTAEIVEDGETGFLFESRDPNDLVQYIRKLVSKPDLASRMGIKGKKKIENCFEIDDMIESYKNVYHEFVA